MRNLIIKICGITSIADAVAAADFGADMIGLIFVDSSLRRVNDESAKKIIRAVTKRVQVVGVFQDHSLELVVSKRKELRLDLIQFHGTEPPSLVQAGKPSIKALTLGKEKAVRLAERYDGQCDYLLFDRDKSGVTGGGTESIVSEAASLPPSVRTPFLLAGGLNPENVGAAVHSLLNHQQFAGIDVASGVESAPGLKDHKKMQQLITKAREALSNAGVR